jgi:CIC family chloride channel protein
VSRGAVGVPRNAREQGNLLALALLALVLGAVSGLVAAVFRLALQQADEFRNRVLAWARGGQVGDLLLVIVLSAATTALAAWLVRRFAPLASGSGIPNVETVLSGEQPPAPLSLVIVKFFGGVLSIGTGLALGREGPSVQMGACISHWGGTLFRRGPGDCLALLAAGAGAGLATAFNAPIAGAVFVLEELVRCFDTRIIMTTLAASGAAIAAARTLLGDSPDFQVAALAYSGPCRVPLYLALGVVAGFLGIAYNRTLLGTLAVVQGLRRWPVEARAALIGAGVGALAWFAPDLVGGGDTITQRTLASPQPALVVLGIFLLRFGLGAVSYAAETPGGLFAPLLVLGSQSGLLFGVLCGSLGVGAGDQPVAFAVVGMAAFFTAVVRAPVTGIVLVIEMTASFTLLLPMLLACAAAMLVTTQLRDPPIYDSLRERAFPRQGPGPEAQL